MKMKSLASIDREIDKVKDSIEKAQQRITELSNKYEFLKNERKKIVLQQIAKAYKNSGKTYHEIMTFLESSALKVGKESRLAY